ncbi:alginate O-acetyltransferase complex protein AlgJ [Desulfovibrionales bacterium]
MQHKIRIGKILTCSLFIVVLNLPLAAQLTCTAPQFPNTEKRILAPMPCLGWEPLALTTFPAEFNKWYNDHFGLRSLALLGYSLFKVNGLGLSSSDKVIRGREGWLYYRPTVEHWRARSRYTKDELTAWKCRLTNREVWLAGVGARYLFIMVPNKPTIYPEFLPPNQIRILPQTASEQLASTVAGRTTGANTKDLPFLDLTPILRKARRAQVVYYRTDSHWNEAGCLIAYRAILDRLTTIGLSITPQGLEDFTTTRGTFQADLASMLGLADFNDEITTDYHPRISPTQEIPIDPDLIATWQAAAFNNHKGQGTLLMIGDSFGRWKLLALLSIHFKRTAFVHRKLFPGTVAAFESCFATIGRPDKTHPYVVLEETVEHELGLPETQQPITQLFTTSSTAADRLARQSPKEL